MINLGILIYASLISADTPRFEAVVASREQPFVGELSSFGPNETATVGQDNILAGDLIELRQIGAVRPMPPWDKPHLLLANGDRWPGNILSILADKVKFAAEFGSRQELTLPLSAIVAVWLTKPQLDAEPRPNDLDLAGRKRTLDEVHLVNGDAVRGTIATWEKGAIMVDVSGGIKKFPVERVAAISLNSELARVIKPQGAVAKIVLTNGCRLTVTNARLQDGRLVGKSLAEQDVRLLLADIANVAIIGGQAAYLSELEPIKYEHTPYLGLSWPLTRDRNAAGGWLRLGADAHDRGIGMHSQSTGKYAIPAGATRFESRVGLDAVVGARGRVIVAIRIDGRNVLGPLELAGGQPAKNVALAIPPGSTELSLVVEFGPGADVQDHVNWGDARFVGAGMNR